MAIKLAWQTPQGVTLPNAYLRVMFFSGNKNYIQYSVHVSADEKARREERPVFEERNFSFEYPQGKDGTGDIIVACYEHLKSLPEFSKGLDV
jgi:hypothetical protein